MFLQDCCRCPQSVFSKSKFWVPGNKLCNFVCFRWIISKKYRSAGDKTVAACVNFILTPQQFLIHSNLRVCLFLIHSKNALVIPLFVAHRSLMTSKDWNVLIEGATDHSMTKWKSDSTLVFYGTAQSELHLNVSWKSCNFIWTHINSVPFSIGDP